MSHDQDFSPQEAEAVVKRLFIVAELLAKGTQRRRRDRKAFKNLHENHKNDDVQYGKDERITKHEDT